MTRFLVGTSGFSYPTWRGPFYPDDVPQRAWLAYYAERFATVEINNTFYRMPKPELLEGWRSQVGDAFRFALKAPQRITHYQRLKPESFDGAAEFVRRASALGVQCGPLFFQLPPNLRADPPRLDAFLAALPSGIEAAVEFRHESWHADETYRVLEARGVALCIADTEDLATPLVATAPFGYVRLRREGYADGQLAAWARRLGAVERWERTYVYLKHDDAGRAPALARDFLSALG
jgi:uncharacterized protein YecE (DUF72 family)